MVKRYFDGRRNSYKKSERAETKKKQKLSAVSSV